MENVVNRRAGHILVNYNKNLYMWGGYMEKEHEKTYNLMTQSNARYHSPDEVWLYSTLLNVWSRKICTGDIPLRLTGSSAGVINHCMYVFGGYNDEEIFEGSSNILWRLDLRSYVWKRLDPSGCQPNACEMSTSWVYKDKLYIFGGYGPSINRADFPVPISFDTESGITSKGWLDQLVFYDSVTNSWKWPKVQGSKPRPRAAHAADVLKTKAYVFGGRQKDRRLNDFHCIDLETYYWTKILLPADSFVPQGRSWHTLSAVSENKVLLYGGFSSTCQVLNDCWLAEIYFISDEVWGHWKELDLAYDHGEPRCNHCATSISSGQVWIVSGLTQPYYLTMQLLIDHAEEMLRINLTPPSLFDLVLEYVSERENIPKKLWAGLTYHLRKILEVRTDPSEIHGIIGNLRKFNEIGFGVC